MERIHTPVLCEEVLMQSAPLGADPETYLDCTFGRGGHAEALFQKYKFKHIVALDRDLEAISYAKEKWSSQIRAGTFEILHANFFNAKTTIESKANYKGPFDTILADLGISSPQIDQAHRGFSFQQDGPLDMRMDHSEPETAADIVNNWEEEDLIQLFREVGEVENPFRVTRAIVTDRKIKPFTTTLELASMIERVEGWKVKGHHPATKYFMALRIQLNQEIEGLKEALEDLMNLLSVGGRLLVISFHSIEDRIVKQTIASRTDLGKPVNKKVIEASEAELKSNTRSRSAKLRVFERTAEPYVREKKNKYSHKKGN